MTKTNAKSKNKSKTKAPLKVQSQVDVDASSQEPRRYITGALLQEISDYLVADIDDRDRLFMFCDDIPCEVSVIKVYARKRIGPAPAGIVYKLMFGFNDNCDGNSDDFMRITTLYLREDDYLKLPFIEN